MIRLASILLGVACGIGAAVWSLVAFTSFRDRHRWHALWYATLAAAYLVAGVVIIGRLVGRFAELPQGFSILILAPIIAVPPAIAFNAWLKARILIRQRGSS